MLPNIENQFIKERTRDEMPQSGTGKTITTTEPKFVPGDPVEVIIKDKVKANLKLIDCVGYMVPGAIGHTEGQNQRYVNTPWNPEPIPFVEAAEMGTKKVITEHSTIGVLMTTDGSITEINRDNYIMAEERVVKELKEINKPFIILLNSVHPNDENTIELSKQLTEKYGVPVQVVDCLNISDKDIELFLEKILLEFPIKEIKIDLPNWFEGLRYDHWLKNNIVQKLRENIQDSYKISDFNHSNIFAEDEDYIQDYFIENIELGTGSINVKIEIDKSHYYKVISDLTGTEITGEHQILKLIDDLARAKKEYSRVEKALEEARTNGYGYVTPGIEDMTIDEPEIFKQGSRYGIKIKANAPSLHIINANLTTEVAPVIGSESQSQDFINYLTKQSGDNPLYIWQAEIFGKSLYNLVEEQLEGKLTAMPQNARKKIKRTIERIANEGGGGIICIII